MGIEEGTCWDGHWVLYGSKCDNKFHILKKKKKRKKERMALNGRQDQIGFKRFFQNVPS